MTIPADKNENLKQLAKKIVERDEVDEKNVVCKMFVKGKPNNLIEIVKNVLTPLNSKNGGGYYSEKDTADYKLTLLIEKC